MIWSKLKQLGWQPLAELLQVGDLRVAAEILKSEAGRTARRSAEVKTLAKLKVYLGE